MPRYTQTIFNESASNAVSSLRWRSQLDRTATSVWQRERTFVELYVGTGGKVENKAGYYKNFER